MFARCGIRILTVGSVCNPVAAADLHPELKDVWPFPWYEDEYPVDAATTFILAASAAEALTH